MTQLLIIITIIAGISGLSGCTIHTGPSQSQLPKYPVSVQCTYPEELIKKIKPEVKYVSKPIVKEVVKEVPVKCKIRNLDELDFLANKAIKGLYEKKDYHDPSFVIKQRVKALLDWSIRSKTYLKELQADLKNCDVEEQATPYSQD